MPLHPPSNPHPPPQNPPPLPLPPPPPQMISHTFPLPQTRLPLRLICRPQHLTRHPRPRHQIHLPRILPMRKCSRIPPTRQLNLHLPRHPRRRQHLPEPPPPPLASARRSTPCLSRLQCPPIAVVPVLDTRRSWCHKIPAGLGVCTSKFTFYDTSAKVPQFKIHGVDSPFVACIFIPRFHNL